MASFFHHFDSLCVSSTLGLNLVCCGQIYLAIVYTNLTVILLYYLICYIKQFPPQEYTASFLHCSTGELSLMIRHTIT